MQLSQRSFPGIWLAAALLAGCSTQTAYQRPVLDVPAQFKQATPAAAEAGIWRQADPAQAAEGVPERWWELFGDEQLNRLQAQAAAGNQSIAQAAARLRAAQAAVASSQASLFPTLGSTASATRSRSGGASGASGSSGSLSTGYALGLNTSWELDLWGRVAGTVSASQASAQASASDLAAARLSAQATVTQTYFSLRASETQARLLQETLQSYEQSLQLTRNRYRAGVASAADVAQAEAQYKSTQAQLIESQASRAQLEHALAALLGLPPAAFSLEAVGELPQPPEVPAMLASSLLLQRPDIAAAERRVAAANAQVGVARAAFFPALTLSASAGYRGASLSDLASAPNLFWSLGPSLALSLFDGGARSAAVESARASLDLAAATYRQTVLTALQEVEDNLAVAAALAREQQVQAEAVAAASKALEVVSNQYRAGTVAYLNVLSAQTTVLSARRSLIDVRNRRLAAVNTLLKNVAGRWQPAPQSSAQAAR
ncbi:efflux transporter outer membrane subunit [Delftia sp. PS-11]|uniref:efflux transporter outer membrane subunit n=1 Tax=Delftia sp. PS-11 TaxID=2767222 RepID=UPI002453C9EF|nr:efflux transporter outer membrane subunit [Delftia sp. PS-11]KAJ8745222.1 efflux transporter outer membrane subunit [Delftia sp. PS-11]